MSGKKLEQQATVLRNHGKGYEAIEVYAQAKQAYREVGDLRQAAGMQHMIGVSYKIENDLENALTAYEQATDDYREVQDSLGEGRVERDIGVMYEYHDKLENARQHLFKSKELLESAPPGATTANGEKQGAEVGITLAKLGFVTLRLVNYDEAEAYMIEGLAAIRKAGHPFYEMTVLMHLGSLYFTTQHYDRMLTHLQAALGTIYEYDMQSEQTRRLAQIWGLMAHGYLNIDNKETARHFADKAFTIIDTLSASAAEPIKKRHSGQRAGSKTR